MSRRLTALLLTIAAMAVGCSSALRVTRYDPSENLEGEGSVYFLPKVLLELRFGVEVTARPGDTCARVVDDCQALVEPGGIRLVDPELVPVILPDDEAGYVLESQGTFVTETDFTATFNEVGELLSTNATVTDRSLETAAWGVETLGKLFATVVMAGGSELKLTQQRATRRDQLLKAIRLTNEAVSEALDQGDVDAVLEAETNLAELYGALAAVEADLTTTTTLPVACTIDPTDVGLMAGEDGGIRVFDIDPGRGVTCPAYAFLATWLKGSGLAFVPPLPTIKIRLTPQASVETLRSPADQWEALRRKAGSAGSPWVPGLVYRIPAWFEVSVLSTAGPLLHSTLAVPQLGQLAALTIDPSSLRKDRSFQISLYEGLGSVQEVHYQLSAVDLESATQVVDAVVNMKVRQAEVKADQMAAETAQIQAEMDLLEAQRQLEALKEEIEAEKAAAAGPPMIDGVEPSR